MMNGTMYSQDPSSGFYTGNGPIHSSYDSQYPSTFQTNVNIHELYARTRRDNMNSQQAYSNNFNQHDNNVQRPFYNNNQPSTNNSVYNFENGGLTSTEYYNRIHAHFRSNSVAAGQNSNTIPMPTTNSKFQQHHTHSSSVNSSRQQTPAVFNGQAEPTFLVVPAAELSRSSPIIQVIYTFDYRENYTRDSIGYHCTS
jgi:hypothetical protein